MHRKNSSFVRNRSPLPAQPIILPAQPVVVPAQPVVVPAEPVILRVQPVILPVQAVALSRQRRCRDRRCSPEHDTIVQSKSMSGGV
jgi:hypothetical protein